MIRRGAFLAGALATAMLSPQPLAAEETRVLSPISAWHLDYGVAVCRMVRMFGSKDAPTALLLEQHAPSAVFSTIIAGGALDALGRRGEVEGRFGDVFGPLTDDRRPKRTLAEYGPAVHFGRYKPRDPNAPEHDDPEFALEIANRLPVEDGAAIAHITLSRKDDAVRLETGDLAPVFEAINTCTRDLATDWGLEPDALDRIAVLPRWENVSHVARRIQSDYPRGALVKGAQADLHVRVMVEADGSVGDCRITELTTATDFGEKPCETIRRYGEFEPALDSKGAPMRYFYVTRISYRIG